MLRLAFERQGNRILLRQKSYGIVADTGNISQAVDALNYGPIITSFNIESWGAASEAVSEPAKNRKFHRIAMKLRNPEIVLSVAVTLASSRLPSCCASSNARTFVTSCG